MKTVAIMGMGYVGLPLWINFSAHSKVIGIDINEDRITQLNEKKSYITHFGNSKIEQALNNGAIASTDYSEVSKADAIIICVPTPLTKNNDPDLSYVVSVIERISPYLKKNQILSLESTTYPGTCDEVLAPLIQECGFEIGKDFHLVFSPERENPGGDIEQSAIPKLLGGFSEECSKKAEAIYNLVFDEVVIVQSLKVAELAKLLENTYRAVNLGLINEFKFICDAMNIDAFDVVEAAATKPFGFVPYYPGPGWGGHCIPIDPFYLSWKAKEFGLSARFIELAGEMNNNTIAWVQNKIASILNKKNLSLSSAKILLLGLSYKENVDDARESPSLKIFQWLLDNGSTVHYSDPHFPIFPSSSSYQSDQTSVHLSDESIQNYDLVVLLTRHKAFDYDLIKESAKLILDTRGVYKPDNLNIFRG
ncbi:nucleotide sugar dehydrogenase [Gammaproteobacteria bacterium]|nr:nucleotide sugar dehydrogenase [Gammaproteobacteria bacterium]